MEQEKENKFYFFKKMFKKPPTAKEILENARKEEEISRLAKAQQEKNQIEKEISFIIDTQNEQQFKVLMDNDILLSAEHIRKIFFESPKFINQKVIDMAYTHYATDMNQWTLKAFTEADEIAVKFESPYEYNKGSPVFKMKTNFENICSFIYKTKGEYLKDKMLVDKLYVINKNINFNLSKWKIQNIRILGHMYDCPHMIDNIISSRYNQLNQDGVISLVKRAKVLNDKRIQTSIAKNIIGNIEKYDTQKLPNESKVILKEINQLFLDIEDTMLNQEARLKVDNLYEKRLPQVLSEYFSIPDRYREILTRNEETPDSLLKDSLNEVKKHLAEINHRIHEQKINTMKTTNKYLKNI